MKNNIKNLKHKLLSINGSEVYISDDPNIKELLKRGFFEDCKLWPSENIKLVPGPLGHCHENVSRLKVQHVFGFGMNNGRWACHSWGWDGSRIIETVQQRELYFGAILPDFLSRQWAGGVNDE